MRELIVPIDTWLEEGRQVALATVISTWGSSPRPAGSVMAITGDGRIAGSVSGGCVEGAVVASALEVLIDKNMRIEEFHATTKQAHEVGLSCGGNIDICIRPLQREVYAHIRDWIVRDLEFSWGINLDSGEEFCGKKLDVLPEDHIFIQNVKPKPQLISIGATHVAIHLMDMARIMGYRTIVIDPRAVFATHERFPMVDELVHAWPEQFFERFRITSATAICALTHDPKIDEPALAIASCSDAFYIGSLGRTTTQESRYEGLKARGVSDEDIARIYGPIGLDIGGKTPNEIALSIMAEINAVKNNKQISTRKMIDFGGGSMRPKWAT